MDFLQVEFPVSGVHTWIFHPPLVAFAVSFFSSMGGVSGAFFLLPYQVSVLQFVTPSVSSTNFVYNIIAIPSGVYRYIRDGRMAWPLAGIIVAGTLPGVFIGYYFRIQYLPDPRIFRLFVGCVLFYIAFHLLYEIFRIRRTRGIPGKTPGKSHSGHNGTSGGRSTEGSLKNPLPGFRVASMSFSLKRIEYGFNGENFSIATAGIFTAAFAVGIIGGAYGIGGGSILAPFCVAVYGLPVYTVAGAALAGTFITSIAGVLFYSIVPSNSGISTAPDWLLGALFGVGGFLGMYCGARLQRFVPQTFIKTMLALIMLFLACSYILKFFAA